MNFGGGIGKMNKLKITLLVLSLTCHLCGENISYNRHEEVSSFRTKRERVLNLPLFYAEYQSYRLAENYLHYWIDRPLFHDSSLRDKQSYRNSFLRNVEIIKNYEIDGFVALSNAPSLIGMYSEHLQALNEVNPYPGFSYMCGAAYAQKPDEKWHDRYLKNYKMAVASPYTLKINGKIPVWGYHSQSISPAKLNELSKILKDKTSIEPILFAQPNDLKFQRLYEKNGKLTQLQMTQLHKMYEELLNKCGGLIVTPVIGVRSDDYTAKPSSDYFQNCIVPLLLELLNEPRFRKKMIAAYIKKGYINHLSGNNTGEYGTFGFRLAMDELMLLNPDVVVFFEWNEANENTHFQPTVNDANTMQRLVKFYARKMRGQSAQPNNSDDLSIPNLIFSSRQVLRLGDTLRYEILNIPDSDSNMKYLVQLILRDYAGNILKKFPQEIFKISELKAVSFEIPTEQLAKHTLILPELRVVNTTGEERVFTMQYNRIHPSVCWNYKEIMQPLRDMLPIKAEFDIDKTQNSGVYSISARVESPETLLHVEVLDNEDEVFAVDREKRYDPDSNVIIQGSFTAFSISTRKIVFEVQNAPGWQWFRECYRSKPDGLDPQIIENKVAIPNYYINFYYRFPFNITVPKSAAANAIIEIDIERLGKHSFKVAELQKLGKMAKAFDGNNRLDLNIVKNLVDIPVHIQQKSVDFKTLLETENRFPVYQLRAISNSGKIYRSRPIMPSCPSGKLVQHNVFSVSKQGPITLEVATDRIPDLKYKFDDSHGAMLINSWEPFFDGQLGGGFIYLEPFNRPRPNLLAITGRKFLHPAWRKSDGITVLEFDGKANYLNLPREALPHSSFTLEFEINPDGNDSQVLFRNMSYHRGSLNLYRRKGKLDASFTYRLKGSNNPVKIKNFNTSLELPEGKWSKVKVTYNFKELKFAVNGEVRKYPFSERGLFFKPSVFGGHTIPAYETGKDVRFFKGKLRSLRIRHSAEN